MKNLSPIVRDEDLVTKEYVDGKISTKIESSDINGNIKVNGEELEVYKLPPLTSADVGLGNVPNVTTNDQKPTFSEATIRTNINSGETLSTILGKIKKFFTDLKTVAFTGKYDDLTNKPNFLTGGSQTTTSTVDGGNNVYTFTTSDGETSTFIVKNGSKGSTGATGKGVASYEVTYQVSSSGTDIPTSTWGATIPATSAGQFLWTKIVLTYSDKTNTTFYSVSRNGSNGAAGKNGTNGTNGIRGSRWNTGTAITGTSTTATIYTTGITDSLINDIYLNTTTGLVYKCTKAGNEATAQWVYVGSIKGADGKNGTNGTNGKDGLTTKVVLGGTTFTHSNGTITITDAAVQKAVTPTAPTGGHIAIYDGTTGKLKDSTFTIATSVPANAKFTDTNTDTKVTQTIVSDNATYPLLLTPKDQTATATTTATFASAVTLNPSTKTITASITGNATTATKANQLTTARTINGIAFNGTTNITITANPTSTLATNNTAVNNINGNTAFYNIENVDLGTTEGNYHYVINMGKHSKNNYSAQIAFPYNGGTVHHLYIRNANATTWQPWQKIAFYSDITTYAPSKTGSGASGNWNINITGNATKDSTGQQINTTYIKALSINGKVITYTRGDNTTGTITTQDTNTTYGNMTGANATTAGKAGLVPAPAATQQGLFLRGDAQWATPANTWIAMKGATASANGAVGYINVVPPMANYNKAYWRADGTWSIPPDNNTWTAMKGATSSANGSVGYINVAPPSAHYNTAYWRADGTWSIPPNTNTDTKVTQTLVSDSANYPLLLAPKSQSTNATTTAYFDSGVYLNPNTNTITANITGNAATANKLGSTSAGNTNTPVYFNAGVPTACGHNFSQYLPLAGGTMTGTINAKDIIPVTDNASVLGNKSKRWSYVYSEIAHFDGVAIGQELTAKGNGHIDFYRHDGTTMSQQGTIYASSTTDGLIMRPATNNTGMVGTSSQKFAEVNATNIYGAAASVVSGSGTKTTALPSRRTKALIMAWATTTNTTPAPVFNIVYVTGLSGNMTAKNNTPIISGAAGTVLYAISTAGAITISVTGNCGWTIIYFN